jgi:transcriptional regulator with XRE-family HTH domain
MHSTTHPDPVKVPGSRLAAQRDAYGIARTDLAARMGLHRNTLLAWEQRDLTVLEQRRYLRALRELVEAAEGGSAA